MYEKIENTPTLVGVDGRHAEIGGLENIEGINAPGTGNVYGLRSGEIFFIPEGDVTTAKYDVRAGQAKDGPKVILVACYRGSDQKSLKPGWVSLNTLVKRDIDGNSVNPMLAGLQYPEVISKLQGKYWQAKAARPIDVQAYDLSGTRMTTVDENNVEHPVIRKQNVYPIAEIPAAQ